MWNNVIYNNLTNSQYNNCAVQLPGDAASLFYNNTVVNNFDTAGGMSTCGSRIKAAARMSSTISFTTTEQAATIAATFDRSLARTRGPLATTMCTHRLLEWRPVQDRNEREKHLLPDRELSRIHEPGRSGLHIGRWITGDRRRGRAVTCIPPRFSRDHAGLGRRLGPGGLRIREFHSRSDQRQSNSIGRGGAPDAPPLSGRGTELGPNRPSSASAPNRHPSLLTSGRPGGLRPHQQRKIRYNKKFASCRGPELWAGASPRGGPGQAPSHQFISSTACRSCISATSGLPRTAPAVTTSPSDYRSGVLCCTSSRRECGRRRPTARDLQEALEKIRQTRPTCRGRSTTRCGT